MGGLHFGDLGSAFPRDEEIFRETLREPLLAYQATPRSASAGFPGQHRFGIPFWLVGEFITRFRAYFSGRIGMFAGATTWGLTHGHNSSPTFLGSESKKGDACRNEGFGGSKVKLRGKYQA